MLAKVNSAALYGIDALRVEVEIDLASGLPQLATEARSISTSTRKAKSISPPDCRNSQPSGWLKARLKKAKTAYAPRLKTAATHFLRKRSPSIWPQPISKKRAPPMIFRWP